MAITLLWAMGLALLSPAGCTIAPPVQDWHDNRTWHRVPKFQVDLDAPAATRWAPIIAHYKPQAPQILAYLQAQVPKWAMPVIQTIAKAVRPYFADYGDEAKPSTTGGRPS